MIVQVEGAGLTEAHQTTYRPGALLVGSLQSQQDCPAEEMLHFYLQ